MCGYRGKVNRYLGMGAAVAGLVRDDVLDSFSISNCGNQHFARILPLKSL